VSEPFSGTTLGAYIFQGGETITNIFPGGDAGVLIASIGGGLIFVVVNNDFPLWKKWLLLLPSILAGLISSPTIASLLTAFTPSMVIARQPLGALIGSTVIVTLLTKFSDNPGVVIQTIWISITNITSGVFRTDDITKGK